MDLYEFLIPPFEYVDNENSLLLYNINIINIFSCH